MASSADNVRVGGTPEGEKGSVTIDFGGNVITSRLSIAHTEATRPGFNTVTVLAAFPYSSVAVRYS